MIENSPSYAANNEKLFTTLSGEKIKDVIPYCTRIGDDGWFMLFLFESGYSLTMHKHGGFWISNKQETVQILKDQLERLSTDHDRFERIFANIPQP